MSTISQKLAVAHHLVERGLKLFPLVEGGKLPAIKDWQAKATDKGASLVRWFGAGSKMNIGVAAGQSGLIVIDTDQKPGRDGDANLRALAGKNARDLDATFTVQSPTGSKHYYFRAEPVRNSVGKLADAVDIRSQGGLVVAPGSVTAKGVYHVINKADIADAPQWLLDAIATAYTRADKVTLDENVTLDMPFSISQAQRYLAEDAPPSIEGRGGNDNAYRVACRLKDFGISEFMAVTLMGGDWNTRCSPPWDDGELERIVGNAFQYGENSPGVASIETEFDVLPDEEPEAEAATGDGWEGILTVSTSDKLAARKLRGYVLKGVIAPFDIGSLFGAPGAGKSMIAPYIAYMVAKGEKAFGRRTKQGGALYVAAEDPTGMSQRVRALRDQFGDAPAFELVEGVTNLLSKGSKELKALRALVAARKPRIIFIDTLAQAFPGIDENSAEGMGKVVAVARSLTKHGAAVILIHHDTKSGDDTPRGHSLLNGALDVAIKLNAGNEGEAVKGKLTKNRNGAFDWFPRFKIVGHRLGTDEDGDPVTAGFVREDGDANERPATAKQLPTAASAALAILREMDTGMGVEVRAWRRACADKPSAVCGEEKQAARNKAFTRAFQRLMQEERIRVTDRDGVNYAVIPGTAATDFEVLEESGDE